MIPTSLRRTWATCLQPSALSLCSGMATARPKTGSWRPRYPNVFRTEDATLRVKASRTSPIEMYLARHGENVDAFFASGYSAGFPFRACVKFVPKSRLLLLMRVLRGGLPMLVTGFRGTCVWRTLRACLSKTAHDSLLSCTRAALLA